MSEVRTREECHLFYEKDFLNKLGIDDDRVLDVIKLEILKSTDFQGYPMRDIRVTLRSITPQHYKSIVTKPKEPLKEKIDELEIDNKMGQEEFNQRILELERDIAILSTDNAVLTEKLDELQQEVATLTITS